MSGGCTTATAKIQASVTQKADRDLYYLYSKNFGGAKNASSRKLWTQTHSTSTILIREKACQRMQRTAHYTTHGKYLFYGLMSSFSQKISGGRHTMKYNACVHPKRSTRKYATYNPQNMPLCSTRLRINTYLPIKSQSCGRDINTVFADDKGDEPRSYSKTTREATNTSKTVSVYV